MKFQFEKLIPNEEAKTIIETYENAGYIFQLPKCRSEKFQMEEEDTEYLTLLASPYASDFIPVYLPKDWFKEPLKFGIWYNREEFDGNPNNYVLLERKHSGRYDLYNFETNRLGESTTHFMYIEPVKDK